MVIYVVFRTWFVCVGAGICVCFYGLVLCELLSSIVQQNLGILHLLRDLYSLPINARAKCLPCGMATGLLFMIRAEDLGISTYVPQE